MSKMSQLYTELSEQANELGYETLEQAQADGYTINYAESKLVKYECCDLAKEQEKAHEAWEAEKQQVVKTQTEMLMDLHELKETLNPTDYVKWAGIIKHTIEFVRSCHD